MLRTFSEFQWNKAGRKILAYSCDHKFFEYAKASFASFCEYHSLSEWRVIFADVGLHPCEKVELARFGEVIEYPRATNFWPSALAKIQMLTDFTRDDAVLVYLDSDTLIFDNLDNLVSEFVKSDKPLALLIEDIHEFGRETVSWAWRNRKIPEEFRNQDKWRNAPMANAGVFLAQGTTARELGELGIKVFDKYKDQLWLGEQTVIDTLLYDREIPFMKLPPRYNCLAWERHIAHVGPGPKYAGTRPYFRGKSIAIRHFAGSDEHQTPCKADLDAVLPLLDTSARLLRLLDTSVGGITASLTDTQGRQLEKPTIAVAVNVFKEPFRQIEECFQRIARNLPNATVAVFLDGVNRPEVLRLARQLGFLPAVGSHCGTNATWNNWWLRMLHFFAFSEADVCFKFDPDTMVDATPNAIPLDHYFGGVPAGYSFVQGGITGLSKKTIRMILDKKLLESVAGEARPWLTQTLPDFADDQALGCLLRQQGIYPVHWNECRSDWKSPIDNNPITHAIVHPRYYNDTP
jgi:hypothetical protein